MTLTATQYQEIILQQVGDTGVVERQIQTLWDMHSDKAALSTYLQFLYTRLEAILLLIGQERTDVTFSVPGDVTVRQNEKITNLRTLYDDTLSRIQTYEKRRRVSFDPVVGYLPTTEPISPPAGMANANDTAFGGSPYRRFPRVQP